MTALTARRWHLSNIPVRIPYYNRHLGKARGSTSGRTARHATRRSACSAARGRAGTPRGAPAAATSSPRKPRAHHLTIDAGPGYEYAGLPQVSPIPCSGQGAGAGGIFPLLDQTYVLPHQVRYARRARLHDHDRNVFHHDDMAHEARDAGARMRSERSAICHRCDERVQDDAAFLCT